MPTLDLKKEMNVQAIAALPLKYIENYWNKYIINYCNFKIILCCIILYFSEFIFPFIIKKKADNILHIFNWKTPSIPLSGPPHPHPPLPPSPWCTLQFPVLRKLRARFRESRGLKDLGTSHIIPPVRPLSSNFNWSRAFLSMLAEPGGKFCCCRYWREWEGLCFQAFHNCLNPRKGPTMLVLSPHRQLRW